MRPEAGGPGAGYNAHVHDGELPATDGFRPAWWARSGLAQTAVASLASAGPLPPLTLERWATPDGDRVRMHLPRDPRRDAPLVLLLHGLEGSVRSRYVAACARAVHAAGWDLAVLEFRSCGGEPNLLPRSYHSGETGDLALVLDRLAATGRPLCAVGYSLGGNVLLKWLGEQGERAARVLTAAAAVSAPYDLEAAARGCDERYGGLIARHFLRTLVPKALHKARQFPGLLDAAAVRRCRSFAAFDELVTAPLHGFRGALDYWRTQSCGQFLPSVRVPTLLVSAQDDPLVPGASLPRAAVAASRWLHAAFPARGGHVGFVAGGWPWRPRRWAETAVVGFLQAAVRGQV